MLLRLIATHASLRLWLNLLFTQVKILASRKRKKTQALRGGLRIFLVAGA